jgi:WD40 repeat protein
MDAALTADGRRIITVTWDGRARLWDGATGRVLPGMEEHGGGVRHVGFSADGRLAESAGTDRTVRLWVSATGRRALAAPLVHDDPVWHAAFSPRGDRLATASWAPGGRGTVRIYDPVTGKLLSSIRRPYAWQATFSPDGGRTLTLVSREAWLDTLTGGKEGVSLRHPSLLRLGGFSPDGARVFTATHDMRARLWDARGWATTPLLAHGAPIWHAGFSADGRRFRTATEDGVVRTWPADFSGGPTRVMKHDSHAVRLALSPDGGRAVTGSHDRTARLWDLNSGQALAVLRHRGPVWSVTFSPDGRRVATSSVDGTARVWDGRTGRAVSELRHGLRERSGIMGPWVAFSADGRYVLTTGHAASGGPPCVVQVWEAETGRPVGPLLRHVLPVNTAEFSPDGQRVLTASLAGSFVWDRDKGSVLFELRQGDHPAQALATYSRDGGRIVTAGMDGNARVWDARTGRPVSPPLSHGGLVFSAAFSPAGDRVLTAGDDRMLRVWDAVTGEPAAPPLPHRSLVHSASFSDDGRFIVTGSQEGGRVWDAATGRLLTVPVLAGRGGGWGQAALSADNRRVVTADHDASVRVWDGVLAEGDGPAADLVLRARLVAGQRVAGAGLVPLRRGELQDAWAALRSD